MSEIERDVVKEANDRANAFFVGKLRQCVGKKIIRIEAMGGTFPTRVSITLQDGAVFVIDADCSQDMGYLRITLESEVFVAEELNAES